LIVPAASSAVIPEMLEHFVGLFSQASMPAMFEKIRSPASSA
jgi:hypothetical protein